VPRDVTGAEAPLLHRIRGGDSPQLRRQSLTMSRIRRIEVPLRVTVAVAGLSIITVILAPLVLLFVDSILTVDWQRLTAIGQSFTGISALLSAAALVGVAFSIRLQNRQVELARAQAVLELQFAFEQLAVNDEQYWSVFVPTMLSDDSPADRKRKFLRNYMFRYFQFGHKTGEFSEADLRRMLSSFFANAEKSSMVGVD
jgi:hypothetical protein